MRQPATKKEKRPTSSDRVANSRHGRTGPVGAGGGQYGSSSSSTTPLNRPWHHPVTSGATSNTCSFESEFAAAEANASTWEPVVMASGGNRVLIGTDPTYPYLYGGRAGDVLEGNGIAFAGATAGATGAYVDLSCAYTFSTPGTPVPMLDGLSTHGTGQFTVGGAPCAGSIAIVAASGPTAGLHDADLSDWQCSVHEYFDTYPADYTPLAPATDPNVPPTYSATDVDTGQPVAGSAYVLVAE